MTDVEGFASPDWSAGGDPASVPDASPAAEPHDSLQDGSNESGSTGPVEALATIPGEIFRLAQKMEAIGMLVAGVAHELNNPLASIVAFSQLIRTDPDLPEDLRRQAEMLVQEANRTRAIVATLLDFARARPPERGVTELRPLVDSVLALQSHSFGKGGLAVVIDIPDDLPPLSVDRSQMQQVLVNLTVNAAQSIRASGRDGTVLIAAARATSATGEPVVRVEVTDDGPGVPTELHDRLFMPFVTTKARGLGTGLGLSVSFGIVAAHGGTLRHEERPDGVGATFILELPLGREAADDPSGLAADIPAESRPATALAQGPAATPPSTGSTPEMPPLGASPANPPSAAAGPPPASVGPDAAESPDPPTRVLVLDDETAIRDFLGRALKRAGYEPLLAATGAIALQMIRDERPAAILCDHRMAGMNGTEFHDAVAAADPALSRRFAFMSGDVLNPELREFATARGILLLAKPFDIVAVGRTVAALLGSQPVA